MSCMARALVWERSGLSWTEYIKLDRVQCRLIGFFGPARREFTLLLVAKEKGGKLIPRTACQIG